MFDSIREDVTRQLDEIRAAGLYKAERAIDSPQGARVTLQDGRRVLNLCSNNYLGLAGHPELVATAKDALDRWGYGLASVRFICGTQTLHQAIERRVAEFLGMDAAVLYASCFDANGGLFETLLGEEDAVLSDALNHASIIDGIRLCKAQRFRYRNNDMTDLESKLREAAGARRRLIATDGVFSMDGTIASLGAICELADRHRAMVMVDDSHAVGVLGAAGRGTPERCGVTGRVDILTGTFGKALGGASGGYTAARREIAELLRQRSRPYLFSNTLAPVVAAASLKALDLVATRPDLRERLGRHTRRFRDGMARAGFRIPPGDHPIVPVLLGDARLAARMAERMLDEGIYVIGFSYPVVPEGAARIRVQLSAALEDADVDVALEAFARVGSDLGVI
jgi:glycine C-acetyltransferase